MAKRVQLRICGVVSYQEGLELQKQARQEVAKGACDGILLLLQHSPVITMGRSGGRENLRSSAQALQDAGVDLFESERGGNITCHNPGQIVGYPVMNLSSWQEDAHWYVKQLEEVLIETLREFGVVAGRKARYTGVWVGNRKIAAIGVSIRHWITGHGFALNVSNDLSLFQSIVPCGIGEFGVIRLQELSAGTEFTLVQKLIIKHFGEVFGAELEVAQEE